MAIEAVMAVVAIASAAYGAYSANQTAEYNQKVAEIQADSAKDRAKYESNLHMQRVRALLSKQKALYASSAVDIDTGSPATVLQDTAAEGTLDALAIRYGGDVSAAEARSAGILARMQGNSAVVSNLGSAAGSLIRGLGSTSSSNTVSTTGGYSDYGPYKNGYRF